MDKLILAVVAGTVALAAPAWAQPQPAGPDLSGTYRCDGEVQHCPGAGQPVTVTQSGSKLSLKDGSGDVADGSVTSSTTLSVAAPWNLLGEIASDGKTINWSNGTRWRKQ